MIRTIPAGQPTASRDPWPAGSCRFGVVTFPGSNCDRDVVWVTRHLLNCPTRLIWHQETQIDDCDVVVIPGGFSYGDYLRCGAMAKVAPVMAAVRAFADRGGLVLGICNGFQVLVEAGMLPGALIPNANLHFICDRVPLEVERTDLPWTQQYAPQSVITLPIAHGEGCYLCDPNTLAVLEANRQVVLRYQGQAANGSLDRIAGICNPEGNVLGLMPHPERAADPALGSTDGWPLWVGLVQTVAARA
ncbi:MAG: phosphoribosylformylglycinamidine synthase subunit PurQ [Synechococcaceae cyanobacterium SM2_3_2]|nr:phosphoribosylformylglycinamidine synthase subunit PurQ [Synechococcaceae cyanobacterium SM2_3_2]